MLLVSFYLIISINTTVLTEKNFVFERLKTYYQNYQIKVYYKSQLVGDYFADLLIEDSIIIIIELKACGCLLDEHKAQLLNYLKATDVEIGLLLNFGTTPEFKRSIYTNDRKKLK